VEGAAAPEHYRSVGVPLARFSPYGNGVTDLDAVDLVDLVDAVDPAPPPEVEPGSLDSLVADCAEVTRHLSEVPRHRVISIPRSAVAMVADMGGYGD